MPKGTIHITDTLTITRDGTSTIGGHFQGHGPITAAITVPARSGDDLGLSV